MMKQAYKYFMIVDVKSQCPHDTLPRAGAILEVIEFSAVIIRTSDFAEFRTFNKLVRPVETRRLSPLTIARSGISQTMANEADVFMTVYCRFCEWVVGLSLDWEDMDGDSVLTIFAGEEQYTQIVETQMELVGLMLPRLARYPDILDKMFFRWADIKSIFTTRTGKRFSRHTEDVPYMIYSLGLARSDSVVADIVDVVKELAKSVVIRPTRVVRGY